MMPLKQSLLPARELTHFGTMQNCFNDEEVDRIKFFKKILEFTPAETVEGAGDYRVCESSKMPIDQNTQWLWDKVGDISASANYDLFLYDIEYIESLEYLVYEGSNNSKYDWHADASFLGYRKYDRKISATIMLSDPTDYEGGELIVDATGTGLEENFNRIKMQKGDVTFFDSHFRHCVTPVTSGVREVLVFWVHGKNKL